jgi:hypothetical protein
MFYPTGIDTGGRCLVCMKDEKKNIKKSIKECGGSHYGIDKFLDENNYCVESWQMRKYLGKLGISRLDEDGEAGAPAAGFNTLGNVGGMGNPSPPTNGGTNAGFYDASKSGSGDRFGSLGVGAVQGKQKKNKSKRLLAYHDFLSKKSKMKNKKKRK